MLLSGAKYRTCFKKDETRRSLAIFCARCEKVKGKILAPDWLTGY